MRLIIYLEGPDAQALLDKWEKDTVDRQVRMVAAVSLDDVLQDIMQEAAEPKKPQQLELPFDEKVKH